MCVTNATKQAINRHSIFFSTRWCYGFKIIKTHLHCFLRDMNMLAQTRPHWCRHGETEMQIQCDGYPFPLWIIIVLPQKHNMHEIPTFMHGIWCSWISKNNIKSTSLSTREKRMKNETRQKSNSQLNLNRLDSLTFHLCIHPFQRGNAFVDSLFTFITLHVCHSDGLHKNTIEYKPLASSTQFNQVQSNEFLMKISLFFIYITYEHSYKTTTHTHIKLHRKIFHAHSIGIDDAFIIRTVCRNRTLWQRWFA